MKTERVDQEAVDQHTQTACPFCRSAKVTTTSKTHDASAYWRCEACGQVWNVGRNRPANRFGYGGR
jgi:transposase-like protein